MDSRLPECARSSIAPPPPGTTSAGSVQTTIECNWGRMTKVQVPARCRRTEIAAPSQPRKAAKATIARLASGSGPLSAKTAP
jgi:hypothetical protein